MKIQRLLLKAFGPFTEVELDLAAPAGTVNVIFGENEAGKSSALRALEGLCFGIETRSPDDHVHNYNQMRVGATLELADGTRSTVFRRKANKNTLSDESGSPVQDETFEKFLCGVGRSGFEALFCLSYQRLSEGSKSILEENGELGKLLFEARSDLSLRSVQTTLSKRVDDLFKGTARSSATIDKALGEYDNLRKILKRGDIAEYKEILVRQANLEKDKDALEVERGDWSAKRSQLNRWLAAVPLVRRLNAAQVALDSLGQLPDLGPEFGVEFQGANDSRREAESTASSASESVESLESQLSDLSLNSEVLLWRGEIDRLNRKVGQIIKDLEDAPDEERKTITGLAEARSALSRVRPGEEPDEANLNIDFGKNRITILGREKSGLNQELISAKNEIETTSRRLIAARKQLEKTTTVQVPVTLAGVLRAARSLEDSAIKLPVKIKELRELQLACDQQSSRLGAGDRPLLKFVSTQVPSKSVIHAAEDELRTLDDNVRRLDDEVAEARVAALSIRAQRQALLSAGDIVTDVNLRGARKSRDLQWHELKVKITDPAPISPSVLSDFEESVVDADEIADRLHREADRAAKLNSIDDNYQAANEKLELQTKALETAILARDQANQTWQSRWVAVSIQPESPRQMVGWLDQFENLGKEALRLEGLKSDIDESSSAIDNSYKALVSELGQLAGSGSFSDLIAEADRLSRQSQQSTGAIEALQAQIQADEVNLVAAQEQVKAVLSKLKTWRMSWETETTCLKLAQVPTPEEADLAIKEITESLDRLKFARLAERRAQGMRNDIREFTEDADKVVAAIASELHDMPATTAIQNLHQTLNEALGQQGSQSSMLALLNEQKQRLALAKRKLGKSLATLSELCKQAGCKQVEDLAEVVRNHSQAERLRLEIAAATKDLQVVAAGRSIAELSEEVDLLDDFTLQSQLADVENEIDRVNRDLETIHQQIGIEKTNMAALDLGKSQVEAQLQAEAALAKVRSSVRPYLVYAAADSLIRAQIEEFRRANQGPILKMAGEVFSVLTNGSFSELTGELDEKDQPVLIAVRKSKTSGVEERLKVEALSVGTRMGLYLSLRLACVYHHVDQREGIPFVADDILLDFDDARARRVMEELGRLAEKTQVILFTHHKHLVDIGRDVLGAKCHVQNLTR